MLPLSALIDFKHLSKEPYSSSESREAISINNSSLYSNSGSLLYLADIATHSAYSSSELKCLNLRKRDKVGPK